MIRLIVLFILLFSSPVFAGGVMFSSGGVSAGGVTCSGDGAAGANESFEDGTGTFCTTGWTLVNTDSVIDTYSTGFAHTGTHSMAITKDADSATAHNRAYLDLGTPVDELYARFYVYLPYITTNYAATTVVSFGDDNNEAISGAAYITWERSDATNRLKIRTLSTNPTTYFSLAVDTKYRIEVRVVRSNTSALRVYDASNNPIEINTGGGVYELTLAGLNVAMGYVVFNDNSTDTTASTTYIDDVVVDVDAVTWIGAQ